MKLTKLVIAIYAASIALFSVCVLLLSTNPAKSEDSIIGSHDLAHQWTLTLGGPERGVIRSCGVTSIFNSPGTDLVDKNEKITIGLVVGDRMDKGVYSLALASSSWSVPKGFKGILQFDWGHGNEYEIKMQYLDSTSVIGLVNGKFLKHFAREKRLFLRMKMDNSTKEIGVLPLIGSNGAVKAFKACAGTLNFRRRNAGKDEL